MSASFSPQAEKIITELLKSYEATLQAWARAAELRDQEGEGHTQRVVEMTLHMARRVGIPQTKLIYVKYGALLHDIGKLAIPDFILLKTGPLLEEERDVMRKHVDYAYEWLSGIKFLEKALDIPYCHHEKWDGTGYPRGLKGEEIPLAARIFALVDVWDALRSERPFRQAWPVDKVRDYIQNQAGKHFDPNLVPIFLEEIRYFELQSTG